jgi:hypothetical protein
VSRADRALVLVGAACVVGLVVSLFVRELPDAWAGLASTIIGTVLGGAILAGLLTVAWRWWREAQEVRLLRGFLEESGGSLNRPVALYKAVAGAKLQDPSPVVDRLRRKRQIGPWPKRRLTELEQHEWESDKDKLTDEDKFDPDYFYLNYEGRDRAEKERWWWPGGFWV